MLLTLKWTDPTTLADGTTAIPANDFADVEVNMSIDNGKMYTNVGHAAPGAQQFQMELTDPGTYLFKLEAKDTQTPAQLGPDSAVVQVTVPAPPLQPIAAPTNVQASLA